MTERERGPGRRTGVGPGRGLRRGAWASGLALLLSALAFASSPACTRTHDSPEEAFVKVRSACAKRDWARLFDTFPPDTQAFFDQQVAGYVTSVKARAKITSATEGLEEALVIERLLGSEMKVTVAQWESMMTRERFAVWFEAAGGASAIHGTGFDPDIVGASELKSIDVQGATAQVSVDDGRGHRSVLSFVLVDRVWRFDLGYE